MRASSLSAPFSGSATLSHTRTKQVQHVNYVTLSEIYVTIAQANPPTFAK